MIGVLRLYLSSLLQVVAEDGLQSGPRRRRHLQGIELPRQAVIQGRRMDGVELVQHALVGIGERGLPLRCERVACLVREEEGVEWRGGGGRGRNREEIRREGRGQGNRGKSGERGGEERDRRGGGEGGGDDRTPRI